MSTKQKAMLLSFLRVLGGCVVAAITTVMGVKGYMPLDFTADDWKAVANSLFGAILVTAGNALRSGETRFGRGAEDIGMGGADTITPPDGMIQTPDGPVEPPVEMLDPQPVDEVVETPPAMFAASPEPEPEEARIRSTPLDEVRLAARKAPAKKATKRAPKKMPPA